MDPRLSRAAGESPAKGAADPGARTKGGENRVSESDVKRMGEALKEKGKRAGESADGAQRRDLPGELTSLFHQALDRLNGQASTPADAPRILNAPEARPADAATSARCGELVDRILASAPADDGSAEVRMTIDKPWLPETEVRLALTANGRLEVEFRTDSVEAQRFLSPNLDTLRERLAEKSDGGVAVRLTEGSRESGGDGRSRNRRKVISELDEE